MTMHQSQQQKAADPSGVKRHLFQNSPADRPGNQAKQASRCAEDRQHNKFSGDQILP